MADADNISRLPVRFKRPSPEDRTLVRPWEVGRDDKCMHQTFVVDEKKLEVECAVCGERMNPMWVLVRIATKEHSIHEASRRYKDEMARLADRSRTKCDHCGKITRISRK